MYSSTSIMYYATFILFLEKTLDMFLKSHIHRRSHITCSALSCLPTCTYSCTHSVATTITASEWRCKVIFTPLSHLLELTVLISQHQLQFATALNSIGTMEHRLAAGKNAMKRVYRRFENHLFSTYPQIVIIIIRYNSYRVGMEEHITTYSYSYVSVSFIWGNVG